MDTKYKVIITPTAYKEITKTLKEKEEIRGEIYTKAPEDIKEYIDSEVNITGELSVDDTEMLTALANALLEAGYTVDEIQRRFEGAHLNVDMDTSGIIEGANEVIQAT